MLSSVGDKYKGNEQEMFSVLEVLTVLQEKDSSMETAKGRARTHLSESRGVQVARISGLGLKQNAHTAASVSPSSTGL